MDLAGGLCHYCTMGLPPERLFYLYIPSGCLDSRLLLQTEGDSFCSACKAVSIVVFCENEFTARIITWRQQATYCVGNPFWWAPCDGWRLSSMFVWP